MVFKALLTDFGVKPEKGELVLSFRNTHSKNKEEQMNLGILYIPNQKHIFFSEILGKNMGNSLQFKKASSEDEKFNKFTEQIDNMKKNKKAFSEYSGLMKKLWKNMQENKLSMIDFMEYQRIKDKYWWIYQIYLPMELKEIVPNDFIKQDYTQWARRRLSCPGKFVDLDDSLIEAFRKKNKIKNELTDFRKQIDNFSGKSYATRQINDLDEILDKNPKISLENLIESSRNVSSLKKIDKSLIKKRKKINDEIIEANNLFNGNIKIDYSRVSDKKGKRDHKLRLEKTSADFLKKAKAPSLEDVVNFKWAFIDIEIPHFKRKNAGVTWVGVKYYDGKKEISRIHTIHDIAPDKSGDYEVIKHKSIDEMIKSFTEEFNKFNPDVVSTYNTRFDLIKLRETLAGFKVGENKTDPLYKVTTKFFERIGIRNRLVIDFFRWQKIARAYDINAKLEMAAGFEKSINYDQLAKFEDYCIRGGKIGEKASNLDSRYLASDVDSLFSLFNLDEFRKNMEDILWMSDKFNISIERLLHMPNVINEFQEEGYFETMGITRKNVFPYKKTKQTNIMERKCLDYFMKKVVNKSVKEKEIKGVSNNVCKVFIPIGDFFREPLSKRSTKIGEFFDYKDKFEKDKHRVFFLEQYAKAFSRWITVDYARFLKDKDKHDKILSKNNINFEEMKKIYYDLWDTARKKGQSNLSGKLGMGNLAIKDIEQLVNENVKTFAENKGIKANELTKIVNLYSHVRKKQRHFFGNYEIEIWDVENILNKRFEEINNFIEKNDLEIVAKEGCYLYLKGNKSALEKKDAPVIMVDEAQKLYHSDKVYYSKNGFFSNIQFKDHPGYHLSMFEMNAYKGMIENLIEGDKDKAEKAYERTLRALDYKKMPVESFLFENKSKGVHSAFVKNSDYKNGKIYFMTKEEFALREESFKEQETDFHYDDEKGMNYFIDGKVANPVKVYIIDERRISHLEIDLEKYRQRLNKKSKAIFKGANKQNKNEQLVLGF